MSNEKEAGFSSRYSTANNLLLPRELAIIPLFSGKSSDIPVSREFSLNDFGSIQKYEIDGPILNKNDFAILLSIIKLIDNQTYSEKSTQTEYTVSFQDLFKLLCLTKDEIRTNSRNDIANSLNRIISLKVRIKSEKKFEITIFNFFEKFVCDYENIHIQVTQSFLDFFRESTSKFLCHIDYKKFHDLSIDAARLYLFLLANQNVRFITRSTLNTIFEFEPSIVGNQDNVSEISTARTKSVAEREVNRTLKSATEKLNLSVSYETKNRKTTKMKLNKYPNL